VIPLKPTALLSKKQGVCARLRPFPGGVLQGGDRGQPAHAELQRLRDSRPPRLPWPGRRTDWDARRVLGVKGLRYRREFRQWNNATVPLARFKDRVYTTANTFAADVEVAHFGSAPLANAPSRWSIVGAAGKVVASGSWDARAIPRGKGTPLGKVSVDLAKLPAPAQYKLVVELQSGATTFKNDWNFWLLSCDGRVRCSRIRSQYEFMAGSGDPARLWRQGALHA